MLTICINDKSKIKELAKKKGLSNIVTSNSNLIDDIILNMAHNGIIACLDNGFDDRRKRNSFVPFRLIIALAIAAKMRIHTSLTDIPVAIRDHRVLAELGYNFIFDNNRELFTEGTIRYLLSKYTNEDLVCYYNNVLQERIMPLLNIKPNIHILDCTKIAVNLNNDNYEKSYI